MPKKTKSFFDLARIVISISLVMTLVIFIVLLLFGQWVIKYFKVESLDLWILALPLIVLLNGYQQIADSYNVRRKQFGVNARARIFSVIVGKATVTGLGLGFGSFVGGLISGEAVIRSANFLWLLGGRALMILKRTFGRFQWEALKSAASTYKNYPLYIFPSSILVQSSVHIPVFFISKLFDVQMLGYYALAVGLLSIPVQVIGFSIGKVFLQKANEIVNVQGKKMLGNRISKLYYGMIVVGAFGYGLIFGWGSEIFSFVAGKEWYLSGEIAKTLSFALVFQIVGIVLGPVFRVFKKEKLQFKINFVASFLMILAMSTAAYMDVAFFTFIEIIATLISIRFMITLAAIFAITRIGVLKHIFFGSIIICIVFFINWYLNHSFIKAIF